MTIANENVETVTVSAKTTSPPSNGLKKRNIDTTEEEISQK